MDPVRPAFPQAIQGPQTPSAEAARLAAQKAFFEIAAGRAPAPADSVQTAAAAAPSQPSSPPQRIPEPDAPAPQKILRPGSLLDIRV